MGKPLTVAEARAVLESIGGHQQIKKRIAQVHRMRTTT